MKEKLDIDWGTYLNECADDIDTVWQKFINKFEQADRECIPIKIVKTGKRKFSYPLDRKALAKRKKKYRLWKRFMDTKDAKVYEEYCRRRNQVRRLTRKAIKSQEKDIAKKTKTNSKVFWKFVNSKIKVRSTIPELYTTSKPDPNKITKNDHEKAEVLGKFFSSVYVKEPEWTWVLDDDDKANIKEELKLDITKEIISKKLHELNINKSPGPDNMHPKVLKELASVLIDPLFIIFNISLRLGKIPSA